LTNKDIIFIILLFSTQTFTVFNIFTKEFNYIFLWDDLDQCFNYFQLILQNRNNVSDIIMKTNKYLVTVCQQLVI